MSSHAAADAKEDCRRPRGFAAARSACRSPAISPGFRLREFLEQRVQPGEVLASHALGRLDFERAQAALTNGLGHTGVEVEGIREPAFRPGGLPDTTRPEQKETPVGGGSIREYMGPKKLIFRTYGGLISCP